jgi:hypothetical protein
VDLVEPPDVPQGCIFIQRDILTLDADFVRGFDFVCASSPCEQFSVHGMKHFFPNPPHPEMGIKLFEHTREICESAGVPYVMENVRAAQKFVGQSVHRCGPFHLWGNSVPPLIGQGVKKGFDMGRDPVTGKRNLGLGRRTWSGSKARAEDKAIAATIPPELANCVADYAERLLERGTS